MPAQVDLAGPAFESDRDGVVEAPRDPVSADEVPPGPTRDHGQLDVETCDPVRDLVDGPVAADGNEQVGAHCCLARQLRELPGPRRDQRVAAQAQRGRAVGELGPAPARRAVLGRRVDQEDRAVNG
jgi:hypothetical protein